MYCTNVGEQRITLNDGRVIQRGDLVTFDDDVNGIFIGRVEAISGTVVFFLTMGKEALTQVSHRILAKKRLTVAREI